MTIDDVTVEPSAHVVQFYERRVDLMASVGHFLAVAIEAGGVAVAVVATESHRRLLEDRLAAMGIDVADARHGGQMVLLDAATMLSTFVTDGDIDGEAFHAVIGRLMREADRKGRPVRVYGEMVALLWDAGDVLTAIRLESLWNELQASVPFSLYCAYHAESVAGPEHAEALERLCQLHSSVLRAPSPPERGEPPMAGRQATAQFAPKFTAARAARHFVTDALRQWGWDVDLVDDIALVASELAANAVVHAHSPFSVSLCTHGSLVRLEIRDGGAVTRSGIAPRLIVRPGRGLGVVAALSQRWGVETSNGSKCVWAEFAGAEMTPPAGDDARAGST